jgi:predicted AlkP superfamily phosphohydrolase/phosphomutase
VSGTWLDPEDLLALIGEHTGAHARVRDGGILVAAAVRPRAILVGVSIYPTALEQAAALLHGIVRWRPLDLWNAGLGWASARIHLRSRALTLMMPAKERMTLTDELMTGELDSVDELTIRLAPYVREHG